VYVQFVGLCIDVNNVYQVLGNNPYVSLLGISLNSQYYWLLSPVSCERILRRWVQLLTNLAWKRLQTATDLLLTTNIDDLTQP